jgi:hypothetical protein
VKSNVTSDVELAAADIPKIKENFAVTDVYVDGGYCGQDVSEAAAESSVNMHYTDMTGKKDESDKISAGEFEYNEDNTVKACPANINPTQTKFNPDNGGISAHFDKETCDTCGLKDQCCVKEQVKANKLSTTVEALNSEKARETMKNERKENTSKRAAIEAGNSELKRRHGLDDVRVLGKDKVAINTGLKITACNFKRFAKNCINRLKEAMTPPKIANSQGGSLQF